MSAITKDVFSSDGIKRYITAALIAGVGAQTDGWGTAVAAEGNWKVIDWNERLKAYATNTALKGLLSGDDDAKSWLSIAGTGALLELYKYSVGRVPDSRPGVERSDGPKFSPLDGNYIPRVIADDVREGNNIGRNWPSITGCSTWYSICHGTPASEALNLIPGFNSFATLHDSWMGDLESLRNRGMFTLENFGSMAPALIVNYGALYEKYRPEIKKVKKNADLRN